MIHAAKNLNASFNPRLSIFLLTLYGFSYVRRRSAHWQVFQNIPRGSVSSKLLHRALGVLQTDIRLTISNHWKFLEIHGWIGLANLFVKSSQHIHNELTHPKNHSGPCGYQIMKKDYQMKQCNYQSKTQLAQTMLQWPKVPIKTNKIPANHTNEIDCVCGISNLWQAISLCTIFLLHIEVLASQLSMASSLGYALMSWSSAMAKHAKSKRERRKKERSGRITDKLTTTYSTVCWKPRGKYQTKFLAG